MLEGMYNSWKHLLVKDQNELTSVSRIKKIPRARGSVGIVMLSLFSIAGLICFGVSLFFIYLGVSGFLIFWEAFGGALTMLIVGVLFTFGARLINRERKIDLIRNYLQRPQDFDFVTGTLDSYSYHAGDGHRRGRIIVEGKAVTKDGKELHVYENFSPDMWPFTTAAEDEHLREGDDWYDMKGKRSRLPVQAHFICERNNPKVAVLIGVDEHFVQRALKNAGMF